MGWFDAIKKDIAFVTLAASTATKTTEEPRDILARNIRDNITLFENPSHKKTVRGEQRDISPMFRATSQPDVFEVCFTYCHKKLELEPGMHVAVMPKQSVKPFLERMVMEVETNKVFDIQLKEIRNNRSAAMSKPMAMDAAENAEKKSA